MKNIMILTVIGVLGLGRGWYKFSPNPHSETGGPPLTLTLHPYRVARDGLKAVDQVEQAAQRVREGLVVVKVESDWHRR